VVIDLNGEVIDWRNPPEEEFCKPIEEAIKKEFGLL
jgi:hypothetical protein